VLAEAVDDGRDGSWRRADGSRDFPGGPAFVPEVSDRVVEAVCSVALGAAPPGGSAKRPARLPGDAAEQELGRDLQRASQRKQGLDRRLTDAPLDERQAGLAEPCGLGQRRLSQMAPLAGGADVLPEDRGCLVPTGDRLTRRRRVEYRHVGRQHEEEPREPFRC